MSGRQPTIWQIENVGRISNSEFIIPVGLGSCGVVVTSGRSIKFGQWVPPFANQSDNDKRLRGSEGQRTFGQPDHLGYESVSCHDQYINRYKGGKIYDT